MVHSATPEFGADAGPTLAPAAAPMSTRQHDAAAAFAPALPAGPLPPGIWHWPDPRYPGRTLVAVVADDGEVLAVSTVVNRANDHPESCRLFHRWRELLNAATRWRPRLVR